MGSNTPASRTDLRPRPCPPVAISRLRPSDTHLYPTRQRLDGDSPVGVVREADPELRVKFGLVLRVGLGEDFDDVAQGLHQCSGLGLGELAAGHDATELCLGRFSLSFDLGDPLRNRDDCLAFVQERLGIVSGSGCGVGGMGLADGAAYPTDLAAALGVSRSSLSNHLTCLRGCGFVRALPEGRSVRYELVDERFGQLMRALSDIAVADHCDTCDGRLRSAR